MLELKDGGLSRLHNQSMTKRTSIIGFQASLDQELRPNDEGSQERATEAGRLCGRLWYDRSIIYVGAYAMELGVVVKQEHLDLVRYILLECTELCCETEAHENYQYNNR